MCCVGWFSMHILQFTPGVLRQAISPTSKNRYEVLYKYAYTKTVHVKTYFDVLVKCVFLSSADALFVSTVLPFSSDCPSSESLEKRRDMDFRTRVSTCVFTSRQTCLRSTYVRHGGSKFKILEPFLVSAGGRGKGGREIPREVEVNVMETEVSISTPYIYSCSHRECNTEH